MWFRDDPVARWSFVDPRFSSTPFAPTSASEVPLVDATFGDVCGGVCSPCTNQLVVFPALEWAAREACLETEVAVECRNGGPNYNVFRATTARIGTSNMLTVDMNHVDERYDHALFFAYLEEPSAPGSARIDAMLMNGEHLLIQDSSGNGDILGGPGYVEKDGDGFAIHVPAPITNDPSLVGLVLVAQAIVADRCPTGVTCIPYMPPAGHVPIPWAFTNAQDLTVTM